MIALIILMIVFMFIMVFSIAFAFWVLTKDMDKKELDEFFKNLNNETYE